MRRVPRRGPGLEALRHIWRACSPGQRHADHRLQAAEMIRGRPERLGKTDTASVLSLSKEIA
jgi:hypothetical protein